MRQFEERVAILEARVQEQAVRMQDFRDGMSGVQQSVVDLRGDVGRLRDELRGEIATLREEMDRRFDRVDQKFTWLVGIAVATGLATIGTVAGAFFSLLQAIQQHA